MKLPLIALCLLSFILINAVEANYKKDYCGNQEYVTRGDRYPHLHCDKDFIVLSNSKSDHDDLARGDIVYCARIKKYIGFSL